jgi:hypothetical protein
MAMVKVDPDELRSLIEGGTSQAAAARHFGVSEAAISQQVRKLQIATSKVIALERAADVVDQQLSASERLRHVQTVIFEQLAWAEEQAKQPGANRTLLADVIIKLSAEVRAQLRLEHDVSRTLIDLRVVREFQQTVFEVISREDPDVARRILARLKEQRALRQSVELPPLDGRGGDFDVA